MKDLCVQIHPDRVVGFDLAGVRMLCEVLARDTTLITRFSVVEGEGDRRYVNVVFETTDIPAFWERLWREVYQHDVLGKPMQLSSMAMCHGEHGWDDYLLLHHYDPAQTLDRFEHI
jgi:hypothetical protein